MKKVTKQNQNYFLITMPMLHLWFEKMKAQQASMYPVINKLLPSQTESADRECLRINFSDWDMPCKNNNVIIEEYVWGVRCGISQYINIDNCSLASVLEIAKTDHMCEIYSPAKVQYCLDGSRKVIPHQVSAYNTEAKFDCYNLIDLEQAMDLFPQYLNIFSELPKQTKFLCSPQGDKIRIANQEVSEIGFNFNYVDCRQKKVSFRLGNLRATFQYIAQEIADGNGKDFCKPEQKNSLDFLYGKICLLAGGKYPYEKAVSLASEEKAEEIRRCYIKNGLKGKREFTVLINGDFVEEDVDCNRFIKEDGTNITICVPPSVYKSWGQPFTKNELKAIYSERKFDFDKKAEKDYFCKLNQLRFDQRQIRIYRQYSNNPVIEVERLEKIMEKQLQETSKLIKGIVQRTEQTEQERREQMFRARDTSGPSRSSIYTNF